MEDTGRPVAMGRPVAHLPVAVATARPAGVLHLEARRPVGTVPLLAATHPLRPAALHPGTVVPVVTVHPAATAIPRPRPLPTQS